MNEIVTFPEGKIKKMIDLLERGLEKETDRELKRGLKQQIKDLKDYARQEEN